MSDPLPVDDADERPWERPGALRRDCAPHRAGLIAGLGLMAWSSSILGAFCCVLLPLTVPTALALGAAAWTLGRRDVRAIIDGRMDPTGLGPTEDGVESGRGTIWNTLFALAGWGAVSGLTVLILTARRY